MRFITLLSLTLLSLSAAIANDTSASPYAKWSHGFPADPGFFPIAVWMQSTRHADQFHQAGINTYVALSDDLTDATLAALKKADMKLVVGQDAKSLKYINDPTIVAWMHGDEPDNAQSLPDNKGYGPPIAPQKIIDEYNDIAKADPSRPVMLNLGLSVAVNDWVGRGTRTGHAEDYPEYIKGADIVSFDIYPVAGGPAEADGKLWYVAKGVDHLVQLAQGKQVVWNCIETSHIGTKDKIATPHQVRSEVWMSIIHGSMGLIYFLHEFTPFKEAAILDNPDMLAAVTAINKQIASLAPVLNSPTVTNGAQVQTDNADAPVDVMVKSYQGLTYIFAAEMRNASTKATITVPGLKLGSTVTVLDENRTIDTKDTSFTDTFDPWDVHIYQIKE